MRLKMLRLIALPGIVCYWTLDCGVGGAADIAEPPRQEAGGKDAVDLVKKVHAEWAARCEKLGPLDPRPALAIWGTELKAVIADRVPKERMHAFMLAVTAEGPGAELTGLHRSMVVQGLVDIFSRAGDRAELVELLSRDFPERMYHGDVEFWLAFKCRQTVPNAIEVLFDAFDRSKDPKVQEKIAASLGRAFRANGLDFGKNKTTVDACRSWYAKNKREIEPNINYGDNVMHDQDVYARRGRGLFVSKAAGQRAADGGNGDTRTVPGKTGVQ
jgi:hypothetical protein